MFGPPMFTNDPCDVNTGVSYGIMNFYADISDALYWALQAATQVMTALEKVIRFIFPSGVAWTLWENNEVPDFRIPKRNFAWQKVKILGRVIYARLPNIQINGDWIQWVQGNHIIEGSMNWDFIDPSDGTVKKGSEFAVPRGYSYLYDLWIDFGPIIIILALVTILWKLGLGKAAVVFIQKVFQWNNRRKMIANTDEEVAKVLNKLENMHVHLGLQNQEINVSIEDVSRSVRTNGDLIREIASIIGLRMRM